MEIIKVEVSLPHPNPIRADKGEKITTKLYLVAPPDPPLVFRSEGAAQRFIDTAEVKHALFSMQKARQAHKKDDFSAGFEALFSLYLTEMVNQLKKTGVMNLKGSNDDSPEPAAKKTTSGPRA